MSQPVRRDAARNRQALIEVATRLFVSAGADGEPSLRLMAREAGAGIGTLFQPLREVTSDELGQVLNRLWGNAAASIRNQRRLPTRLRCLIRSCGNARPAQTP